MVPWVHHDANWMDKKGWLDMTYVVHMDRQTDIWMDGYSDEEVNNDCWKDRKMDEKMNEYMDA